MKIMYIFAAIFLAGCATPNKETAGVSYKDKRFKNTYAKEGIAPHKLIKSAKPAYPIELRRRGIEGIVVLAHDINKEGRVEHVEVLFSRPPQIFDNAAVTAAYEWEFTPAESDGKPIKSKNIVMHTAFCAPNKENYQYKEPTCWSKEALTELKNSIEVPKREYEFCKMRNRTLALTRLCQFVECLSVMKV